VDVSVFLNTITLEPFEISSWNFCGSKIWSKACSGSAIGSVARYALPGYGDRRVRGSGWPDHCVRLQRRMLWD